MEIKRILSKTVGLEDWIEVGGKVRFDGKICKVTKIEEAGEMYKVTMTDAGFTSYDALNQVRPLFAVNAVPVESGKIYEMTVAAEAVEKE